MESMTLQRILAQLSCSHITHEEWYRRLFGRPPDSAPMDGLKEWHHESSGGFQLFENPEHAGKGSMTVLVEDIEHEHARLESEGLNPGPIEPVTATRIFRLTDPDGNLIVLAEG